MYIYIECAQESASDRLSYIYVCFLSFRRKQTNEMEFCGGTAIAFFWNMMRESIVKLISHIYIVKKTTTNQRTWA